MKIIILFALAIALSGCAILPIAGGVAIEHDLWCNNHQSDPNCR